MDAQGEDFSPAWVQSGFDALCFELSCLIGGQEQFAEGIRCSCIKLHAITSYWSEIRLPVASFASNSTPSSTVQSPSRISLPHHLHLPKAPTADLPHTCRMPFATANESAIPKNDSFDPLIRPNPLSNACSVHHTPSLLH